MGGGGRGSSGGTFVTERTWSDQFSRSYISALRDCLEGTFVARFFCWQHSLQLPRVGIGASETASRETDLNGLPDSQQSPRL